MNIYFLVEGRRTEKKIYPAWLQYLIPQLQKVEYYDQVQENNYYLISGKGYPSILGDHLENALEKIQEKNNYDYLVLCVDADEELDRCIETWLLGNNKLFDSRQPQELPLSAYVKYYDVSQNDPELMGKYDQNNYGDFHEQYLKEIFNAKNLTYTKNNPGVAKQQYYLEQLIKRVENNNGHLKTFKAFIEFCEKIREEMS